ncbi:MAG: tetratricopeptide repeat protein [Planctomycetota bacterium]
MTILRICLTGALLVATMLPLIGEEEDRDLLFRADGRVVRTYVERELREHLEHKVQKSMAQPQEQRYRELRGVHYHGMDDPNSFWARATTAQRNGDWGRAAENFKKVYQSATREWEQTYGLYSLGLMLERLGQWQDAADVFGKFQEDFPEHRLVLNALYHQGVSLAMAEQYDGAQAVMGQLEELSRGRAARDAESRMRAIEALVAVAKGNTAEAQRRARSVRIRFEEGDRFLYGNKDVWLHWSRIWGNTLEAAEEWDAAARHYEEVLEQVMDDPSKSPELLLTVARIEIKAEEAGAALYRLLRLDVLPIGSTRQRSEARVLAAGIMLDQAEELDGDERDNHLLAARTMLEAVTQVAEAAGPHAATAQELMARLPGQEQEAAAPAAE